MKSFLLLLIFIMIISHQLFSQTKPAGISRTEISRTPEDNTEISEIIRNLNIARTNENISAKLYWEKKLNVATNIQPLQTVNNPPGGRIETNQGSNYTDALNVNQITGLSIKANAISRERVNGDIYLAIALAGVNNDTLRIYRSTNNGNSFMPIYTWYWADAFTITENGIDIEAISRGDSSFAYVSVDFVLGSGAFTAIATDVIRVRQDGGVPVRFIGAYAYAEKITNSRITSDNAQFLGTSYVYFSETFNFNDNGSRRVVSRLYKVTDPFAYSPTLTPCYSGNTYGSYGYEVAGNAPATTEFESDLAYVCTTGNIPQLYTVTIVNGVPGSFADGTSLYFTRSNTYGATAPALFNVSDITYLKNKPRIAATGYLNNTLCVITNRKFSATDWDPYNFYSSNIDATVPIFNGNYVNSSSDYSISVSAAARYRSNGTYLFSYSSFVSSTLQSICIRPFTSGTFGTETKVNSVNADFNKGFPDASFRNVNNDSCISIWGGKNGVGSYVTTGCSGPFIGVNNTNSNVEDFHLSQNYPNPFNPSTKINFTILKSGFVSLKLYDNLGRLSAELVNENLASGTYDVGVDAATLGLSSGIYYYKLESNNFAETRKMILAK